MPLQRRQPRRHRGRPGLLQPSFHHSLGRQSAEHREQPPEHDAAIERRLQKRALLMRNLLHPAAPKRARLIDDRRGTAAIEFAFIFPVMLTLFFGSFEVTNLLMLNLKLTAATEDASDLLAQTRSSQNNVAPSD